MLGDIILNYELKEEGIYFRDKNYRDIGIILKEYSDSVECYVYSIYGGYSLEKIKTKYIININIEDFIIYVKCIYDVLYKFINFDWDNYHEYYCPGPSFPIHDYDQNIIMKNYHQ